MRRRRPGRRRRRVPRRRVPRRRVPPPRSHVYVYIYINIFNISNFCFHKNRAFGAGDKKGPNRIQERP